MKKSIILIMTALLLTACNFTILGENDDEVVLEKRNITIVERNITIEELSGIWVIEEESIERDIKISFRKKEDLQYLRKKLNNAYVKINENSTAEFRDAYGKNIIYRGKANLGYIPKSWKPIIDKDDYYIRIMYQYKDSYGVESSKGKDLYFIELNNKFYLGEKFTRGEEETNSQRTYYSLYRKVESIEVNNEPN